MIKEEALLERWNDLAGLVEGQFKKGWIFRGVRSSEYDLIPSIGRQGARKNANGLDLSYSVEEEQRVLDQFTREARKFGWQPQSRLEWMILGQHHRLPTRLLDWSESLLVAAYFAVDGPPEKDAAIYGVEAPKEIDLNVDPFDLPLEWPLLVRPPHISPRITAQKGVLTLHQQPDQAWKSGAIHRWRIPGHTKFTLKGILDFCGLHAASLFPDSADRHTEHLAWLHKWGRTR